MFPFLQNSGAYVTKFALSLSGSLSSTLSLSLTLSARAGKWTAIEALELGMPVTLIGESVFARCLSALKARAPSIYHLKEPFMGLIEPFVGLIEPFMGFQKLFMRLKEPFVGVNAPSMEGKSRLWS